MAFLRLSAPATFTKPKPPREGIALWLFFGYLLLSTSENVKCDRVYMHSPKRRHIDADLSAAANVLRAAYWSFARLGTIPSLCHVFMLRV